MPAQRGGPQDPKGLYATLGVSSSADVGEIRRAYRRLALRWHPDKNPDDPTATAEFQKISASYEVLSEPDRRQLYDSTGCIDQEELAESGDPDHFRDLFATFFGGFNEDLDDEEQTMFDDFLRFAGSSAFQRKPRGRKKGRRGRGGRCGINRLDEDMLGEVLMAAMGGGGASCAEPSCPQGHSLKRRKVDEDYECDICQSDIVQGKRFYDCRKCDYSVCLRCHKQLAAEAEEQAEEDQILEVFCDMHSKRVREGHRLIFRCELCGLSIATQVEVVNHMKERHSEEIEATVAEFAEGGMDIGFGGGLEELFMAGAMEDIFGAPSAPKGGARRSRRR